MYERHSEIDFLFRPEPVPGKRDKYLTHLPIRLGSGKGLGLGQGWPARWRRAKRSPAGGAPSVRGPGVAAHGLEDFSYIADTARRAM